MYGYSSQIWLFPEVLSAVYVSVNGPNTDQAARGIDSILFHTSDIILRQEPWVGEDMACCCEADNPDLGYPDYAEAAPAQITHVNYMSPVDIYEGVFGNSLVGDLRIERNAANVLELRLGKHVFGELLPGDSKDQLTFSAKQPLSSTREWKDEKVIKFVSSGAGGQRYSQVVVTLNDGLVYEFDRGKLFEQIILVGDLNTMPPPTTTSTTSTTTFTTTTTTTTTPSTTTTTITPTTSSTTTTTTTTTTKIPSTTETAPTTAILTKSPTTAFDYNNVGGDGLVETTSTQSPTTEFIESSKPATEISTTENDDRVDEKTFNYVDKRPGEKDIAGESFQRDGNEQAVDDKRHERLPSSRKANSSKRNSQKEDNLSAEGIYAQVEDETTTECFLNSANSYHTSLGSILLFCFSSLFQFVLKC